MKKGLTMLVVAMVIFALVSIIGSAAATAVGATPISSVATTAVMIVFGIIMTIGVALYAAMRHKKGHTSRRPGRSVKALNAVVLMVLTAVNARHTHMMHARVFTSSRVAYRTYEDKTQD